MEESRSGLKCRVTVSENFQTVMFDMTIKNYDELTLIISDMRNAIKAATTDVVEKKTTKPKKKKEREYFTPEEPKKAEPAPAPEEQLMPMTTGQRNYLLSLGVSRAEVDAIKSFKEATTRITAITGSHLRSQNNG